MNIRSLVFLFGAILSLSALSAEQVASAATNAVPNVKLGLRDPVLRERFMKNTGGWVPDRRHAVGKYVIANVGGKFAEKEIAELVKVLERDLYYNVEAKNCEAVTAKDAASIADKLGGKFTAFLMTDENYPALTLFPEGMCAFVNVAALNADKPDGKVLAMRMRKELMRALGLLMSAGYSSSGRGVMTIVRTMNDLDDIPGAFIDDGAKRNMEIIGDRFEFKPFKRSVYRVLLEQGVAPEPENEYQRKLRDEFRNPDPSRPMKILFDKNKKAGTVK